MTTKAPRTLPEWAHYLAGLSGEALRAKAILANTIDFVDHLLGEGYSAEEVDTLYCLLGQQLARAGVDPVKGLYDLAAMARRVPPLMVSLPDQHLGAEPELLDDDATESEQ